MHVRQHNRPRNVARIVSGILILCLPFKTLAAETVDRFSSDFPTARATCVPEALLSGNGVGTKDVIGQNFTEHMTYTLEVDFDFQAINPVVQGDLIQYQLVNEGGTIHFFGQATDLFLGQTTILNFDHTFIYGANTGAGTLWYSTTQGRVDSISYSLPLGAPDKFRPESFVFQGATDALVVNILNFSFWLFDQDYPIPASATLGSIEVAVEIIDLVPDQVNEDVARLEFRVRVTQNLQPIQGAEIFVSDQPGIPRGLTDPNGELAANLLILAPEAAGTRSETVSAIIGACQTDVATDFYTVQLPRSQTHTVTQWESMLYPLMSAAQNPSIPLPGRPGNVQSLLDLIILFFTAPAAGDILGLKCYAYDAPGLATTVLMWGTHFRGVQLLDENFIWRNEGALTQEEIDNIDEMCLGVRRDLLAQRVDASAFIHVRNPNGASAGYDPGTQTPLVDYPAIFSDLGDEPFALLSLAPADGTYFVDVVGVATGAYTMTVEALDPSGVSSSQTGVAGTTSPGEVDKYVITLAAGSVQIQTATGITGDDLPALPTRPVLHQNYPNPFNPTTTIRYEIVRAGVVTLRIYDASGTLVRELYNGHRTPGVYAATWNGDNDQGQRVAASGVYFYRLHARDFTQTKKMILIK